MELSINHLLWKRLVIGIVLLLAISDRSMMAGAQTTRKAGVIYVPKVRGEPRSRTDGATRGGGNATQPVISVIMPEEPAITTNNRPTLYWRLDKSTPLPCDILIKTVDDEPIFTQRFDASQTSGLIAFDMATANKALEPGQTYRFVVLIAIDPNDPAGDLESSGMLRYEPSPADIRGQLDSVKGFDKAAAYAAAGYFTDAVDLLVKENTEESKLALRDLLAQAKLIPNSP